VCDEKDGFAPIAKMNLDGSGFEVVAKGVRNTVGFDFHPKTGDLWFTNNGRDWVSEDLPNDTLNRVGRPGKDHFGYPFCNQGNLADTEFGWGKDCTTFSQPVALTGPHAGTLGMRFCTRKMFLQKYQNAIFLARRGSWNRSKKFAADVQVAWPNGKGGISKMEPFLTGMIENNEYLARPEDVMVMKDGSMLVSDDHTWMRSAWPAARHWQSSIVARRATAQTLQVANRSPELPTSVKTTCCCRFVNSSRANGSATQQR
jgi:glucose/arabinose dehydrogenase